MSQTFVIDHSGGKTKNHPRSKASATKTAKIVLNKLNLQDFVSLDETKCFQGKDWTCHVFVTSLSISVEIKFASPVVDITNSVAQGGFGFYPFLRII